MRYFLLKVVIILASFSSVAFGTGQSIVDLKIGSNEYFLSKATREEALPFAQILEETSEIEIYVAHLSESAFKKISYIEKLQLELSADFENWERVRFRYYPFFKGSVGLDSKNRIIIPLPSKVDITPPITAPSSIVDSDEIKSIFSELKFIPDANGFIKVNEVTCQFFSSYNMTNCQMRQKFPNDKAIQITDQLAFRLFQALSRSGVSSGLTGAGLMQYLSTKNILCDTALDGQCVLTSYPGF
ncbi:MAG: hypothetical protein EOP04_06145 [Proteobacteria bacterium]|nr:MAG: hypothetical protein EOP04_06145 [Pseudomonadota bacterium]